jgi:hypothetical protein
VTRDPDPYPHRMDPYCLWKPDSDADSIEVKIQELQWLKNGAVESSQWRRGSSNEALEGLKISGRRFESP